MWRSEPASGRPVIRQLFRSSDIAAETQRSADRQITSQFNRIMFPAARRADDADLAERSGACSMGTGMALPLLAAQAGIQ
jgi:hypothetical protein